MSLPYYSVRILPEAEADIDDVYDYIAFELFQPSVARKYRDGIVDALHHLSLHGGMLAVSLNHNLRRQYGPEVRTAKYKKMTIIYTFMDNFIIVHRVIAGSRIV